MLLLTFLETPIWCLTTGGSTTEPWTYYSPDVTCPAADGGFIYLSGLPYIPVGWGVVIGASYAPPPPLPRQPLACVQRTPAHTMCMGPRCHDRAPVLRRLFRAIVRLPGWLPCTTKHRNVGPRPPAYRYLTFNYNGRRATGPGTRLWQARLAATTVATVDAIVFLALVLNDVVPVVRVAPFARIVHWITVGSVMTLLSIVPAVIAPVANVFLIYMGAWALFAWVMGMLLDDYDDPLPRCAAQAALDNSSTDDCTPINDGFDSLGDSFYTVMVTGTNANVPDTEVASYAGVRPFGLLWAVFYCKPWPRPGRRGSNHYRIARDEPGAQRSNLGVVG